MRRLWPRLPPGPLGLAKACLKACCLGCTSSYRKSAVSSAPSPISICAGGRAGSHTASATPTPGAHSLDLAHPSLANPTWDATSGPCAPGHLCLPDPGTAGLGLTQASSQRGSLGQHMSALGPQSPHPSHRQQRPLLCLSRDPTAHAEGRRQGWGRGEAPTFLEISSWKPCSTESRRRLLQLE